VKPETVSQELFPLAPAARRPLRLAALPHPASCSQMLRYAILSLRCGRTKSGEQLRRDAVSGEQLRRSNGRR
jgi:hypothetical protein